MQCILGDSPILEFKRILQQITHMGISIMLIPTVGRWTGMYCIYQNLDNIYFVINIPKLISSNE